MWSIFYALKLKNLTSHLVLFAKNKKKQAYISSFQLNFTISSTKFGNLTIRTIKGFSLTLANLAHFSENDNTYSKRCNLPKL